MMARITSLFKITNQGDGCIEQCVWCAIVGAFIAGGLGIAILGSSQVAHAGIQMN
jgi:hypothetical protein